jgi:cyclase
MLKKRLIPVLLLQNGVLVRSESFSIHQIIGNPIHEVERFNEWSVDELIYLDISKEDCYDLMRDDHKISGMGDSLAVLNEVSRSCFMPLTWGGRIRSLRDIRERLSLGADKITINSGALKNPKLITEAATMFGCQAIVVSIDCKKCSNGSYKVFTDGGSTDTGINAELWAAEVERLGAGEILLQSIDRDGSGIGYDLDLIQLIVQATSIPIIACSGVGRYEDYAQGIQAGASAVAAANIWHFKEHSDYYTKIALEKAGVDVRKIY